MRLKLSIVGQATLAAATLDCCKKHHDIVETKDAEIIWVCYDTPIHSDIPDSEWVISQIRLYMPAYNPDALILVSSQMPISTTMKLEREYPFRHFAHSPENIRVASAIADFSRQSRVVVGIRDDAFLTQLDALLIPFTDNIIYTTPETAEMCKHALNTWLGMNIAFVNELAKIGALFNVDMDAVSLSLKTERRISPHAPLKAGGPYGGGHLARDIHTLADLSRVNGLITPIISSIKTSNDNA